MDAVQWTVIITAIGFFVAMSAVMHLSTTWLKNELKAALRQDIAEFKLDMAARRVEFKRDRIKRLTEFKRDGSKSSSDSGDRI